MIVGTILLLLARAAMPGQVAAQHPHQGEHGQAREQLDPRPPAVASSPIPAAAEAQLATLRLALARYADFEVARREGWKKFGGDGPLVGEHWYLPVERGGIDYRHGQPLNFTRPSSLMYTDIRGRKLLTGVTFNVRLADGEPPPEGFAGPADVWHVHDFRAFFAAALGDRPAARWLVERTMKSRWGGRERLAMIHVWAGSIPNPDGPFAHYNRLVPYLKLGLDPALAEGASLGAARGLNLATPGGCAAAIDGAARMAGVSGESKARLHRACESAAAHVRQGLSGTSKAQLNRMAEHGWVSFDSVWNRELNAEQKARIAAITEHGHPVPPQGAQAGKHH